MKYAEKDRKFSQVSIRYSDDAGGSRLLEIGEGICIVTAAAWNLFASGYLEYDKETVSCGESTSCAASCVAAGFRLCADTCDVQQ